MVGVTSPKIDAARRSSVVAGDVTVLYIPETCALYVNCLKMLCASFLRARACVLFIDSFIIGKLSPELRPCHASHRNGLLVPLPERRQSSHGNIKLSKWGNTTKGSWYLVNYLHGVSAFTTRIIHWWRCCTSTYIHCTFDVRCTRICKVWRLHSKLNMVLCISSIAFRLTKRTVFCVFE